jgi:hypothetical protein
MSSTYLIYPICFTVNDFANLSNISVSIREGIVPAFKSDDSESVNIKYYLFQIMGDIKEIINNKNLKGYRHNSFILNMISLKITYCYELIKKHKPVKNAPEMTKLGLINYKISVLLSTTNNVYVDNFE